MADKSYESMTDEEFMNEAGDDGFESSLDQVVDETETGSEEETETDTAGTDTDVESDTEENSGADEEHADDGEDDDTDDGSSGDTEDTQDDSDTDSEADDAEGGSGGKENAYDGVETDTSGRDADQDTDDTESDSDFDFKAGYKELFKPFKANGREMSVDNVEDARRLMQMGAGAVKQATELKPQMKIIKTLKDNGLLDQDKINHLIDLEKKNPDAIAKLVKESGIDPLDIDTGKSEGYKPTNYGTTDAQYELDQAINNIKGNDSYEKSISVMGEQWDEKSRNIISEHPDIIRVIDEHIQSGIFDTVQGHVDREKALGRMVGMSDVEAYRAAANTLVKSGAIVDTNVKTAAEAKAKAKDNPLKKAVKKKREAKRKKSRKAAAPSKGKASSGRSDDDYSDLSDEEFEKKYGAMTVV